MTSLLIITYSFPYEGGEQFLEEEIKYWNDTKFNKVYLLPILTSGRTRDYPENIELLNLNANEKHVFRYIFRALFSKYFFIELFFILKNKGIKNFIGNSLNLLKSLAATFKVKDKILINIIKLKKENLIAYTYWNDISYYAAIDLKKAGKINKVYSRAHGFDLYEERRLHNYMPLKRQFDDLVNKLFLLSEPARDYYKDKYIIEDKKLAISSLGVNVPYKYAGFEYNIYKLNIISLSSCILLKQIDKIILALEVYAKLNKNIEITWNHIGDGPLKYKLAKYAEQVIASTDNLKISFMGQMCSQDVHRHFASSNYDMFINTSISEGTPVSIMEAMSYGIPAIAPDIGGIACLVNESNGYLLPKKFNSKDIIQGIEKIRNPENVKFLRENARKSIDAYFNANINYPSFVSEIERLSLINE